MQLKQEHEDHSNAAREKLRVMEEQQQFEVQEREKVEFTLRNLELENTKLGNNLKQVGLGNLAHPVFIRLLVFFEYCSTLDCILFYMCL